MNIFIINNAYKYKSFDTKFNLNIKGILHMVHIIVKNYLIIFQIILIYQIFIGLKLYRTC